MSKAEIAAKKLKKLEKKRMQAIPFIYKKDGTLKVNSIQNIVAIINLDKNLQDLFKYNDFTKEVDVTRNWQFKTNNGTALYINKGRLDDDTVNTIELYIENLKSFENPVFKSNLVDTAIVQIAKMYSYNPVKDYLEKCYQNWDHKERLNNFFSMYLGAKKDNTTQLITRLWFLGAVAKVYNPKTKFDYVLDLVGGQGIGKTTLLKKIAPLGLYTDQFNTFTNKDDFEVMKNALIVNDDEMTASNKASFEEIKKFITMQEFEYIKRYGRRPSKFYKKFVISRTTNEKQHLKDRSGDRRFLSIECKKQNQIKNPVTDLPQEEINQLWGEVVKLYKNKQANHEDMFLLTRIQEELLKANREEFRYTTGLEDKLLEVLENKFKNNDFISNSDLAFEMFNDDNALSVNSKDAKSVRYYMGHLGFQAGAQQRIRNKNIKGFRKIQE